LDPALTELFVGPLKILTNNQGWHPATDIDFGGDEVEGQAFNAMLVGPGLALNIQYFLASEAGGGVKIVDILDSPLKYKKLLGRVRQGVQRLPDGFAMKQVRSIKDSTSDRPTVTKATHAELDQTLGSPLLNILRPLGVTEVGVAKEMFGSKNSDLAIRWSEEGSPLIPFVTFIVTRVIPVMESSE
jgi:hypothetical protein